MSLLKSLGLLNAGDKVEIQFWEEFVHVCIEQQYQLKPKAKTTDIGLLLPLLIPKQDTNDLRAALKWLRLANPTGNMQTASAAANAMLPLPKGKCTLIRLRAS